MWGIYNKDQIDILKKTQENLEAVQKNNQMLSEALENYLSVFNKSDAIADKTEDEKLRAAYALNLCMVSVSQIIDYNDIYFLEREYDAILNNLNLEKMPKDEALLRILKQLLDVITFFRIQEGDRKVLEKEYAQKIKDAIWSAVPNPSMIIAGGSLAAIAVSLASQVGIGYMNYRKEKAKIAQDKERKEWELQRSAMEQFNGLRRELFDTAWRLADEYNFPDEYRITERQITQYNNILLDTDDVRRYERLEYISDKFKAYPPFWYYLGNAANAVYQDERYSISVRDEYKNRAKTHFYQFFKITEQNLLREDQLVASCALEMFDLVEDNAEKLKLLEKAANVSGNAFDVLQICSVSYLKIGEIDKACDILKMLVNENYNKTLNAQLLSSLYVSKIFAGDERYRNKYEMLVMRFPQTQYLFPLPKEFPHTGNDYQMLSDNFIKLQKVNLKNNYANIIKQYVCNCENRYYEICKMQGNITLEMANLLTEISDAVGFIIGSVGKNFFLEDLKKAIDKNSLFKMMIESGVDRTMGKIKVPFDEIFKDAFTYLANDVLSQIMNIESMSDISNQESVFYDFAYRNKLGNKDINTINAVREISLNSIEEIFGSAFLEKLDVSKRVDKFLAIMNEKDFNQKTLVKKTDKTEFLIRGDTKFKPYLERNRNTYKTVISDEDSIVAILNDTSMNDIDLIFTTNKIYVTGWLLIKGSAEYKGVSMDNRGEKIVIGEFKYFNHNVDMDKLVEMLHIFAALTIGDNQANKQSLADEVWDIIMGRMEE